MKSVHINDIRQQLNNINLIDIREKLEFNTMPKLVQAQHIPMGDLVKNPEQYLSKEICYHLICRSGVRSEQVTLYLTSLGYDIINIEGGMLAY